MIAPTFESLSAKHSKPGRVAFAKVNVDTQGAVAQQYGVRAMPTFLVLRSGSVIDTVQGANPPALAAAVEKAVKLAGPGSGSAFSTPGQRLGGSGVGPSGPRASVARPMRWDVKSIVDTITAFVGLYLVSLFSVGVLLSRSPASFARLQPGLLTSLA